MSKIEDNQNQLVVKDNELIQRAQYNLTAQQQKLICFVISKIKPTDKVLERYTISARDFADITGIAYNHVYDEFRQMIDDLDEKARWIKVGSETVRFRWLEIPTYNDRNGSITVSINPYLSKYLLQLKGNYTQYELWNILSLKGKYAVRLYELLKSYSFQKKIEMDFTHFKQLLCAEQYDRIFDLKKRVLNPAVKEINELTNLQVNYDTGSAPGSKRITTIKFSIREKENIAAYTAYKKTLEKINKRNNQIPGQTSLFDKTLEEFTELTKT